MKFAVTIRAGYDTGSDVLQSVPWVEKPTASLSGIQYRKDYSTKAKETQDKQQKN